MVVLNDLFFNRSQADAEAGMLQNEFAAQVSFHHASLSFLPIWSQFDSLPETLCFSRRREFGNFPTKVYVGSFTCNIKVLSRGKFDAPDRYLAWVEIAEKVVPPSKPHRLSFPHLCIAKYCFET
jgi:hypothetical protein